MTAVLWILFDLALASLSVAVAWMAVQTHDLRRGVLLFIAMGLLLAIVWSRLHAPDLALAEAAIGAGIAGALLMAALRDGIREGIEAVAESRATRSLVNVGALLLLVALSWGLLDAVRVSDGIRLAEQAAGRLGDSGVSNPVTAVLLNYRAYDTLLELAVVFAAVLGVLSLGPARVAFVGDSPVLMSLIRWVIPVLVVTAGYLLWVGAHAPGGAFQAGATLAAIAVLLRLGGFERGGLPAATVTRWLLVVGIGVFVVIGLLVMPGERAFLQYPGDMAGVLILLIEVAATLSIAVALALAYIGGRPHGWDTDDDTGLAVAKRDAAHPGENE